MYEVKFADIGEGIHEGTLFKWLVKKGDLIKDGDPLFLIETDKVTAEIPSPVDGTVTTLNGSVGDVIKVGETVVVIDDGSDNSITESHTESVVEQGSTSVVGELEISSEVISSSSENTHEIESKSAHKILATPVARKLAKDLNVDLNLIKGTGPAGRVMKADIYEAAEKRKLKNVEDTSEQVVSQQSFAITDELMEYVPLSTLRKTISKNMTLSKFTIPHTAAMDEFDVTDLVTLREEHKWINGEEGVKLTYMAFIIKAVVLALKEHPVLNASLDEEKQQILIKKFYNIGIAVDTPEGLMVPVIKKAETLGVIELAKELQRLSKASSEHTIQLNDLQHGTFTITNYGAFGSSFGVPVIKYPEAAILGTGKIVKKPVVINDDIVIRSILPMSISFDHRIMDGADVGRFMNTLKHYLENPMLLILS